MKNNIKTYISMHLGSVLYFISAFIFIISAMCSFCSMGEYSRKSMGIAIVLCTAGYLVDWIVKKQYSIAIAGQFLTCYLALYVWIVFLVIKDYLKTGLADASKVLWFVLIGQTLGLLFWTLQIWHNPQKNMVFTKLRSYFAPCYRMKRLGLLIVMLITSILSLDTLQIIPMWDDEAYVRAFMNMPAWNYTLDGITSYSIYSHLSTGVSFVLLFARELIPSDPLLGMRLLQILLSIFMSAAIYIIFNCMFSKIKWYELVLITLVVLSFPPVLGMQYINLDYFLLLYFVLFLFCYQKKWIILQGVCATFLCFSKEPAVIMYAGFCIGVYIKELTKCQSKTLKSLFTCFDVKEYICFGLPPILWFLFFIMPNKIMNYIGNNKAIFGESISNTYNIIAQSGASWQPSNGEVNSFGFDIDYIKTVLTQTFSLNFLWIVVLTAFILLVINNKKLKMNIYTKKINTDIFMPLFFALIASICFACSYVTYNLYRYKITTCFVILMISCIIIYILIDQKYLRIAIFLSIGILFLVQSYICIDPVTMAEGRTFSTGKTKLISVDKWDELYISNNIVINRQGYDWMLLMQEILRTVDYDEDILILTPLMQESSSASSIWGVHYKCKSVLWNPEIDTISTVKRGDGWYPVIKMGLDADGAISAMEDEADLDRVYRKVYVIKFPFFDAFDLNDSISKMGATIKNSTQVHYRTWSAELLELECQ